MQTKNRLITLTLYLSVITLSLLWGWTAVFAEEGSRRLSGLSISGPSSVNESSSATFSAVAQFSDGSKRTVSARWNENSAYASINSSGVLTASAVNSNQNVTVTASYSYNGVTRSATKTVTIVNKASPTKTLTALRISGPSSVNESSTATYTATAVFSDNTTQNVTSTTTWSDNSSYAAISSSGVLTTNAVSANQACQITARYTLGSITKTAQLSVTILNVTAPAATLSSVTVTGASSINEGTTSAYKATATFSDGKTQDVTTTATWSDNSSYATISAGTLTASLVSSNQSVILSASYTNNGTTKTGQLTVTILDSSTPPPTTSGSHAGRYTSYAGAATCLPCHRSEALAVYQSEHYQWKGKLGAINDFCIFPDPNMIGKLTNTFGQEVDGGCAKCHAGMGAKPVATTSPTDAQLGNIDCLMCHAGQNYKRTVDPVTKTNFIVDETAIAAAGKTTLEVITDINLPTRDTCLNCHTKSGGGDNFKRGDIEEHHRNPATRAFDVHMSSTALNGANLQCTDCHKPTNHQIPGKGVDLRVQEGTPKPDCTSCHTTAPHSATATLTASNATALNTHTKRIACQTCHIPTFANYAPTDMFRDWSAPGELNTTTGLYDPTRTMQSKVTPQYQWWDGTNSLIYKFGTAAVAQSNGNVLMAGPTTAAATTTGAKIYPFKYHQALQPIDTVTKYLLPLKIGKFYMEGNLVNAIPLGQDAVGWPRNPYDFQKTERWMLITHEVAPKENAIGYNNCNACHNTTAPKVTLKSLGYTIKTGQTTTTLCASCHSRKTYSFSAVHPRHTNQGINCSSCHNFPRAN